MKDLEPEVHSLFTTKSLHSFKMATNRLQTKWLVLNLSDYEMLRNRNFSNFK